MNGTIKIAKNRGFSYLFLAILLFSSIFVIRYYFTRQYDPDHIQARLRSKITEAGRQGQNALQTLVGKTDTSLFKSLQPDPGNQVLSGEQGQSFSFFLFRGDSLVAWSESRLILPAGLTKGYAGLDTIVCLPSGWYGLRGARHGTFFYLCAYPIRFEYPFQNDYLVNGFVPGLAFPESVSINIKGKGLPVRSEDGHYLCSLEVAGPGMTNSLPLHTGDPRSARITLLVFLAFLLGTASFARFLYLTCQSMEWFGTRRGLLVIFFCLGLALMRVIQYYSGFPAELYSSSLFGPQLYSSSWALPSLGDFTVNAILVFISALVCFSGENILPPGAKRKSWQSFTLYTLAVLLLLFVFQATGHFLNGLVINASLPLNLQNISALVPESGFGLIIVTAILFSVWLFSARVLDDLAALEIPAMRVILSCLAAFVLNGTAFLVSGRTPDPSILLFFAVFIILYRVVQTGGHEWFTARNMIVFLSFFAVFATFILNRANHQKEQDKLKLLAVKLSTRRNPVTEVLYEQLEKKLRSDTLLRQRFPDPDPENLAGYVKGQYFKDYWRKYAVQVTVCDTLNVLRIQPRGYQVGCNAYFREIVNTYGEVTQSPNLYYLDYGFGKEYYLAILSGRDIGIPGEQPRRMFIELNLKSEYPDQGYPGLLMDNRRMDLPNLSDYSYGMFQDGRLVHSVGSYSYCLDLAHYRTMPHQAPGSGGEGILHYHYKIDKNNELLISRNEVSFLTRISPFSYLFILFAATALLCAAVVVLHGRKRLDAGSLRNRLHVSLVAILATALLAIGIVQVVNIIGINAKKNNDSLREKAYSVMAEVRHKYGAAADRQELADNGLEDFLIKLSNVFFTDINFYDPGGMLAASSRAQIFEEGLVSRRMDPEALNQMTVDQRSIFIQRESIGTMRYSSAYFPLYNDRGSLLGYVNLPSFSRQDELKKEISAFLVTFTNIYILIFLFGLFITVLISNYITAPLALLTRKMSGLRLGRKNERIAWSRQDEIGQLVAEYNRMIDELERSAEMLARSERESAWREMARQVAHEIKNPLTPMKLSAQYLQKAWNEKAEDWDQRLARFTTTLVEQIDTLSAIASGFSDFAKMPVVAAERLDLAGVMRYVVSMYPEHTGIRYEFRSDVPEAMILADRSQLIRVFTNLVNNAIQAVGEKEDGCVRLYLSKDDAVYVAEVSDNGAGISPDRAQHIFQPDFTTKTGGMGLGLAIVKGIVEGMGGEISFISGEQEGTTFIIKIPAYVNP